jgi:hypothetical protein
MAGASFRKDVQPVNVSLKFGSDGGLDNYAHVLVATLLPFTPSSLHNRYLCTLTSIPSYK